MKFPRIFAPAAIVHLYFGAPKTVMGQLVTKGGDDSIQENPRKALARHILMSSTERDAHDCHMLIESGARLLMLGIRHMQQSTFEDSHSINRGG